MAETFKELGFAKLDLSRKERTGHPETVFCQNKTYSQLKKIFETFARDKQNVLGTRCSKEQFELIKDSGLALKYDEISHIVRLGSGEKNIFGKIAVCSAGTADMSVAEEAAQVAEFFGAEVKRYYDIGVAGIHRLLSKIEEIRTVDVIIAIAGMEGALAGVIAGLVKVPVIAVPTSVGYGASFNGLAALLAMLNSCAEGVSVVNIDNGFGAAVQACRILKLKDKRND